MTTDVVQRLERFSREWEQAEFETRLDNEIAEIQGEAGYITFGVGESDTQAELEGHVEIVRIHLEEIVERLTALGSELFDRIERAS